MKAELKYYYNPSIPHLESYSPPEPENFCILFRALVGIKGQEGEESFDIQVCTPQWLLSNLKGNEIMSGRHFIFVKQYDFENIYKRIKSLIESCSGENWQVIAEKISRIGYWEFEDYDPDLSNLKVIEGKAT